MFKVIRTLTILSLAFSLLTMSASVLGKTSPPRSVHVKFAPVEMPKGAGPVSLELAFKSKIWKNEFENQGNYCKEAEVRVTAIDNLQYFGDSVWTVKVDSGVWSSTIINVIIPPNDISGIRLRIKCGRIPNPVDAYFVTTGDTVEFYQGKPSAHEPPPTPPRRTIASFVDTLTEEQLKTKYEVVLDLKESADLKFVEGLVGQLADSNIFDAKQSYYRLWMSLENIIEIRKRDIECGFIDPPLWTPEGRAKRDSTKPRGSLPSPESKTATELVGGISLDHVDGASLSGTSLFIGPTIRFYLRLNNNSGQDIVSSLKQTINVQKEIDNLYPEVEKDVIAFS